LDYSSALATGSTNSSSAEEHSLSFPSSDKSRKDNSSSIDPLAEFFTGSFHIPSVKKLQKSRALEVPTAKVEDEGRQGRELVGVETRIGDFAPHAPFISSWSSQVFSKESLSVSCRQWHRILSIQRNGAVPHMTSVSVSNSSDAHWICVKVRIPSFKFLDEVDTSLISRSSVLS
jgi:hypothetical protein